MSLNVQQRSKHVWEAVCRKVNKAVVFVDNVLAECLHWNGGAMLLFEAGAVDIKEFSSFESGSSEQHKAVFLVSSVLTGTAMQILQDIVEASKFYYIIVLSSLSPAMHTFAKYGSSDDEGRVFHEVEDMLLNWMRDRSYTAEVEYLPVMSAPVLPQLVLLPEYSNMFPLLPTDLLTLKQMHRDEQKSGQGDVELSKLPTELRLKVKGLASSLHSLLEQLALTDDVYSLGKTSNIIASELAALPWAKHRRKNTNAKASILLVDRTLDVGSVVGHHMETLLDKIVCTLPRLPLHQNDVCVDMAPLCAATNNADKTVIVPGCLSHPLSQPATSLLNSMATSKQKEGMMEVNRQVVEVTTAEKLLVKLAARARITPDLLESHVSLFRGKNTAIRKHCSLLQLVLATTQTLRHPNFSKQDSLLGVEKGLLQCLAEEDSASALNQITQTLNREMEKPLQERLYSLEDIFLLLAFVYSVSDNGSLDSLQQERILQAAVVNVVKDSNQNELPQFLVDLLGDLKTEATVTLVVQDLFEKLKSLSRARESLKRYQSIYEGGGLTSQATLRPLLKTVVEDIFDSAKPELPDIEYKSTGFRDLLKSGFGLFMSVSKPRPSDHPVLLIFVLGGVNTTELRQIREAVSAAKTDVQVIVASTSLLKPQDILHRVLVQDNLHPQPS